MAPRSNVPNAGTPTAYAVPSLSEARALRSFLKGEATPEQQKLVWNFIMLKACGASRDGFVLGSADATAYHCGRRSVALQLTWIISQAPEIFRSKGETDQ